MLVVIVIIGILAAILVPTVAMAIKTGKQSVIATELDELAKAIEQYRQDHAQDYPPDFTDTNAVLAHMRAAYPRNTRDVNVWFSSPPWPAPASPKSKQNPANLDAAEALVFWLSAINTNPRDPLNIDLMSPDQTNYDSIDGPGDAKSYFPFDTSRLVDLDGDGWPEYVSKHSPNAPYVYFDGRLLSGTYHYGQVNTRYPPSASHPLAGVVGLARPYRSNVLIDALDNGKTILANAANPTQWQEPGKFQIICAGLDSHFGEDIPSAAPVSKQFPDPNYQLQDEDEDNMMNFSAGKTVVDSVP
jgi:type II secretory pathway pseudopilin PulG